MYPDPEGYKTINSGKAGQIIMALSLHGAHVPHRKNTAGMPAVRMDTPKTVSIPVLMHIGKPASPVVKAGDHVDIGTLIAKQEGAVSCDIHSSVSGTVKKVDETLLSNGSTCKLIIIESDGEMTPDPGIAPPSINSKDELIEAIRASGIVGLGGAGFPTHVKFNVDPSRIEELIINGAECEPYITSDTRTMIDRADDMAYAIGLFKKFMGIKKIIIGIENNKPEAIAEMKKLAENDSDITVSVLPAIYPQGGEKVMIYHTTGKIVKLGKLPIDVGCIVTNCTTMADIGRYAKTGMPLVEKCVTVDGSAVNEPKNVIAPIGTSMEEVFNFCGGFKSEPGKVFYGGPMMGVTVPDIGQPILKNTNAIIAFNEKDAKLGQTEACIRCGKCINVCPFGINPPRIERALREKDPEAMIKYGASACMECGCCSYVCPANRPLVQRNKMAKGEIKEHYARIAAKEAKK